MSESVKLFNALNGVKATREQLEKLADVCVREEQTHIFTKIQNVLFYNEDDVFKIELRENACEMVPASIINSLQVDDVNEEEELSGLNKPVSQQEIYNMVNDLIINTIKKVGHLPWQKEWVGSGSSGEAKNYKTKRPYSGINFILTNFKVVQDKDGENILVPIKFKNPYYLTFNQIKEAKAKLNKGASATRVIYYTPIFTFSNEALEIKTSDKTAWQDFIRANSLTADDLNRYASTIPVIKYYNVYRADDCTGLKFPEPVANRSVEPIEIAQKIIDNYPKPPKYTFIGDSAHYLPFKDVVNMPKINAFVSESFYYCTFFHEIIHSTGSAKRLNRDGFDNKKVSKEKYAFEELIAELGAVFLCSEAGILFHTLENSAKYLKHYNDQLIELLKSDNKAFFKASAMAQKASNYILDLDDNGTPKYLKDLKKNTPKIQIEKPKKANGQEKTKTDTKKDTKKAIKPLKSKVSNVQKTPKKEKTSNQYALFGVNVTTDVFKKMSVTELRKFTLDYYKEHLSGKKVLIEEQLKEVVFTNAAGRKIARGEAMYSEKAAAIEHLEQLIKNSTYNNFGEAKSSDNKEILGYLNFKSKLTIDGVKRHLRIALAVYKNRKTELKNIEVGKKISDSPKKTRTSRNSQSDMSKPLVEDKVTKKNDTTKNEGISKPLAGVPAIQEVEKPKNSNLKNLENLGFISANNVPDEASNVFVLPNEIGSFLQKIQAHKALILIKGTKHTSKSQVAMQVANAFGENEMPVAYIDYEQGGLECKDTVDSVNRNTTEKGRSLIAIKGFLENPFQELKEFCKYVKVIIADSVTDLGITANQLNELRVGFPDVIWCFISQVKENGEMYGGNKMAHNPTMIVKCHKNEDPKLRYATLEKNRGNDLSLIYSIYYKKIVSCLEELEALASGNEYNPTIAEEEETELSPGPIDFPEFSFDVN